MNPNPSLLSCLATRSDNQPSSCSASGWERGFNGEDGVHLVRLLAWLLSSTTSDGPQRFLAPSSPFSLALISGALMASHG